MRPQGGWSPSQHNLSSDLTCVMEMLSPGGEMSTGLVCLLAPG